MHNCEVPMYRVEFYDNAKSFSTTITKDYSGSCGVGKVDEENMFDRVVEPFVKSLEVGGSNSHISYDLGYIPYPNYVKVVVQKGARKGRVYEWKAPTFMVW